MTKRKLEPDPRASNGQAKRSGGSDASPSAGLNTVNNHSGSDSKCSCAHPRPPDSPAEKPPNAAPAAAKGDAEPPPLLLHGARSEPSALLKVQGNVHGAWGKTFAVQPMIDSGASGMGFADPSFVQRCGATVRPSSRRIILADGSEVHAAGEATLSYSLDAFTCARKEATPPVRFTTTFIVTPLAPYELILGIGWLQQHHVNIGFREKTPVGLISY